MSQRFFSHFCHKWLFSMDQLEECDIESIYNYLNVARKLYEEKILQDYDYVMVYILVCLSQLKPSKFIAGFHSEPLEKETEDIKSIGLYDYFPEIYARFNVGRKEWLSNIDGKRQKYWTCFTIFNRIRFKSLPPYVSTSLVKWVKGQCPLILLFYIPSPMEVLRMQAKGTRVVTMLREIEQLKVLHSSPLTYMDDQPIHSRDALMFLLHDLKHIELFIRSDIFKEQVGFFHSMNRLNGGKVKSFFCQYSGKDNKTLWSKIEYVISDMNTYSLHLLKYLKAKCMMEDRRKEDEEDSGKNQVWFNFDECWSNLLDSFGIIEGNSIRSTVNKFCNDECVISVDEAEELRNFFIKCAEEAL